MSLSDKARWDKKYQAIGVPADMRADEALMEYEAHIPMRGLALDLACGVGHNALFLAQRGLKLVALDISDVGLEQLKNAAQQKGLQSQIQTLAVDFDDHQLTPSCFDLIVVIRYLNRSKLSQIQAALRPGGILLYKTFNHQFLKQNANFNPRFAIELDELINAFDNLEIIASNKNAIKANYAILLARKPK